MTRRFHLENSDDVIGKCDFDFFDTEHAKAAYDDEQYIVKTGQNIVGKLEKENWLDGTEGWSLTNKMPLRNKNGVIIGTLGVSKDITALKKAEIEIQAARDEALKSAKVKSEFLANMSHEIRTPMNALIGMIEMLLQTPLSEEQKEYAQTVHTSAEALLGIINDILDFSKIEAGKMLFEITAFDLMKTVEEAVDIVAPRAQDKGLELVSYVHHEVPLYLKGDPCRLRQVLVNFLSNAIKFTQEGEVVILVTKEAETSSNVRLRFCVSDTGIGIAKYALPQIFQAFVQADGSTTRKYGGTGLGLAICKQIIERQGGEIGVDSELGKGSQFWFKVTLEKQPLDSIPPQPCCSKLDLEKLHVLVVDDNATHRQILQQQLTCWGIVNGQAGSGLEAIRLLKLSAQMGQPYELAFLDQKMPEMDGLTVAKAIKEDPAISNTRLLIVTSMGEKPDEKTLKDHGVTAWLVKPVKQSRLFDSMAAAMAPVIDKPAITLPKQTAQILSELSVRDEIATIQSPAGRG